MSFKMTSFIKIGICIFSFLFIIFQSSLVYAEVRNAQEIGEAFCSDTFDPRDSLIGSTIALCLPGILENVDEWQQIKCEQVVCTYSAVSNGLPSIHCKEQEQYKICSQVMGELFQLPFLNVIDAVKDKVSNFFANPGGAIYSFAVKIARDNIKNCVGPQCAGFDITAQTFFVGLTDIAGGIQRLKAISEQGFEKARGPNFCNQIKEIGIADEIARILELSEEEAKAIGVED